MERLPRCHVLRWIKEPLFKISYVGPRPVGVKLRNRLLKAGAFAFLRSFKSVRGREVCVTTNMDRSDLTQHLLDHFETYELLDMRDQPDCYVGTPDTPLLKTTYDEYLEYKKRLSGDADDALA